MNRQHSTANLVDTEATLRSRLKDGQVLRERAGEIVRLEVGAEEVLGPIHVERPQVGLGVDVERPWGRPREVVHEYLQ